MLQWISRHLGGGNGGGQLTKRHSELPILNLMNGKHHLDGGETNRRPGALFHSRSTLTRWFDPRDGEIWKYWDNKNRLL